MRRRRLHYDRPGTANGTAEAITGVSTAKGGLLEAGWLIQTLLPVIPSGCMLQKTTEELRRALPSKHGSNRWRNLGPSVSPHPHATL